MCVPIFVEGIGIAPDDNSRLKAKHHSNANAVRHVVVV
jgi:hypothetical protein